MTNKTVNQRFQQHKGYVNNKKIDKATVLEVVAGVIEEVMEVVAERSPGGIGRETEPTC